MTIPVTGEHIRAKDQSQDRVETELKTKTKAHGVNLSNWEVCCTLRVEFVPCIPSHQGSCAFSSVSLSIALIKSLLIRTVELLWNVSAAFSWSTVWDIIPAFINMPSFKSNSNSRRVRTQEVVAKELLKWAFLFVCSFLFFSFLIYYSIIVQV